MSAINVALVGVGNCACSLVESVTLHRAASTPSIHDGVRSPTVGGYAVSDVRFVAAFDVSASKVGRDLADAIRAHPNETIKLSPVSQLSVEVLRGPTLDGIGPTTASLVEEAPEATIDVAQAIRQVNADVLVSYLPVGSDKATAFYAAAALEASCGFVNCTPTPVAASPVWRQKFLAAGLPVIGDDVKSQLGATVLHRALLRLFRDRGISLTNSYQLNVGGNTDFLNMSEPHRGAAKEGSKMEAIESLFSPTFARAPVSASVGYVPGLGDRKTAHIRLEGLTVGGAPVGPDVKLDVWDSPNSAGVVIDAIRYAKVAMDRGWSGALTSACAYLMKAPPVQMDEEVALKDLEDLKPG